MIGPEKQNSQILQQGRVTQTQIDNCFQLLNFAVEISVTVEKLLSELHCSHGCFQLLPKLSHLEELCTKLNNYYFDLKTAFQDESDILPTRFDYGFFNTWTYKEAEKVITFCHVHTMRLHNFQTAKSSSEYVSTSIIFISIINSVTKKPA